MSLSDSVGPKFIFLRSASSQPVPLRGVCVPLGCYGSVQEQNVCFFLSRFPKALRSTEGFVISSIALSDLCGGVGVLLKDKPVDFLHFCNQLRQSLYRFSHSVVLRPLFFFLVHKPYTKSQGRVGGECREQCNLPRSWFLVECVC